MRTSLKRRQMIGALPLVFINGARAATRSIQVGIYTAQQGEYVRTKIIPPFEAGHECKVFTTEGVTLTQIAALRATRDNPRYSVMFMDDIGIELSKREGLIDPLPADKIPNLAGVLPRFMFYDGYGAAFAISTGGLVINPQVTKPLTTYAELWEPRFRQRFLMTTPKFTQSLYLLIAAASLVTGKPLKEAQYEIDAAWPKMAELKPNVLSTYENPSQVMMVAQSQVDIAGIEYSKNLYPYTVQGAPLDMCFPKEGTFAGINCLSFVKGGPEPDLAAAFINRMLEPSVQQGLATATLTSPSVKGATFAPDIAKYIAYPETKMIEMGLFAADWAYINPRRPGWVEKYNQVFGKLIVDSEISPQAFVAPPRTRSTTVRLSELSKRFGAQPAVDALSLTIEPGSMLALLGPSGCGKTTCLRMIAGLVQPNSGEIFVDGERITGTPVHKRNIGMLFQNYALFPHMTVAENVAFGLEARRLPRAETKARVAGALQLVRLDGYAERMPSQLSGGQQQRVALARCLVVEPSLLLLDEPLGALDKSLRESMQVELRALQQRLGITTIMVTHDQDEALTLADRVAIMRGGRLEQLGSPAEVYQSPATRFVAGFIGVSNFFRGRMDQPGIVMTESGSILSVADYPPGRGVVTVALRPEAVALEPAALVTEPNCVLGTVEQVVYRGYVSHTYLRLDNGETLIAFQSNGPVLEGGAPPRPGTRVLARWTAASNRVVRDD